ncbi:MAG: NAD(P)/FAD-dependent oxidoreductase [Sandaracinus sp.]
MHPQKNDLDSIADVTVIGAGPAGTAMAAFLHRARHGVRVLEATSFPRFVIGESLLPHCMDVLESAGLLEAVKARGYMVKPGALFLRGNERCGFTFGEQHTRGWGWTWQVPRADFDQTLSNEVERLGVPIHWKTSVTAASFDGTPTLEVRDASGARHSVRSRFVVDASGYGRVLPKLLGLDRPSDLPTRMSLFTHVRGDRRPAGDEEGRIWICVHPRGAWIWIIPFSNGLTSVGAVSTPDFFDGFTGSPEEKLRAILASEPSAAARLAGVSFEMDVQTLRGYSASVSQLSGPGYCLVGNATEFLDPVFSSGVTLALESSQRAAGLVSRTLRGEKVDWATDYDAYMASGIDVFRTFVTRWYDGTLGEIFFGPRQDPQIRAQICSVLGGYVWDASNPLVREHARKVPQLARIARDAHA